MKLSVLIGIAGFTAGFAAATVAGAQTLGELGATTAIQGTLTGNAASGAQGTLGTVRKSLAGSQARANAAWKVADGADAHGSSGATKAWATAGGASTGRPAAGKGWAAAASSGPSTGHGWVTAGEPHQAARR